MALRHAFRPAVACRLARRLSPAARQSSSAGWLRRVPRRHFRAGFTLACGAGALCGASALLLLPVSAEADDGGGRGATGVFGPDFIADAAELAAPSVVNLTAVITSPRGTFAPGGGYGETDAGTGSGFIISADGYIVTNAHVVARASEVRVTLYDGTVLRGTVHSRDVLSDIALVKVDGCTDLPIARIGSSSALRAGQWVVALGSPLSLQNTVTAGIVSAVARQASELGLPQLRAEYIQTDAAINRGNSGGPLVNLAGEVVGVNTMKVAGAGISFAIPIDTAWQVVKQLRASGVVVRPYLGFRMVALTPTIAAHERLAAPDERRGVMVVGVSPHGPAARAGVQPGDVVVRFGGKPVRSTGDIHSRLGAVVGREIDMEVSRRSPESGERRRVRLQVTTAASRT